MPKLQNKKIKASTKKTEKKVNTKKNTKSVKPKVKEVDKTKKVAKKITLKKKATVKEKLDEQKGKIKTTVAKKSITKKKTPLTKSGRKVEIIHPVKKVAKQITGYSKKELTEFKEVILAKRSQIIESLQNLKEQMMDTTTGQYVNENSPYSLHMAEQGTDAQEREKLYLWAQRETKFLGYLEDALQRIEKGTYGICIDSLELPEGPHLIPKERLMAVPHTQHCVACKNKKVKA